MRLRLGHSLLFGCALLGLFACAERPGTPTASVAGGAVSVDTSSAPKELSPEELDRYLADEGNLFFLDVREPQEIQQLGSIEGYTNIPIGQLEGRLSEIPKDKLIITA